MKNSNEDLYSKRNQLIQYIDNQEDKLADEHWFNDDNDDKDGTRRRRMEKEVEEMYIELNEVRDKINELEKGETKS